MANKPEKKNIKKLAADEVDLDSLQSDEAGEAAAEGEDEIASEETAAEGSESDEVGEAAAEGSEEGEEVIAEVGEDEVEEIAAEGSEEAEEEAAAEGSEEVEEEVAAEGSEEAEEEAAAEGSEEEEAPVAPVAAAKKPEAKKVVAAKPTKKVADDVVAPPADVAAPAEAVAEGSEESAEEEAAAEGSEEVEEEVAAEGSEEDAADEAVATDEMIVEPITEASVDDKDAEFDLVLINAESKNPHWLVLMNGEPLSKICLADQENQEDIREAFVSEGYAVSLRESITSVGASNVLNDVKARYYHAYVRKADVVKQIVEETEKNVTAKLAEANDTYNERLMANMGLVVEADAKNFFAEPNAFKAALIHSIKKAGVDNAEDLVEEAFLTHAAEFFQHTVDKAAEWCAFTPETMKELTASIKGAGHRDADYGADDMKREAAVAPADRKVPGRGVALTTYGSQSRQAPQAKVAEAATDGNLREKYRGIIHGMRRR